MPGRPGSPVGRAGGVSPAPGLAPAPQPAPGTEDRVPGPGLPGSSRSARALAEPPWESGAGGAGTIPSTERGPPAGAGAWDVPRAGLVRFWGWCSRRGGGSAEGMLGAASTPGGLEGAQSPARWRWALPGAAPCPEEQRGRDLRRGDEGSTGAGNGSGERLRVGAGVSHGSESSESQPSPRPLAEGSVSTAQTWRRWREQSPGDARITHVLKSQNFPSPLVGADENTALVGSSWLGRGVQGPCAGAPGRVSG